jgi:hypothetical protein
MFIFFSQLLFNISNQVIPFLALNIFFVGDEKGSNTWKTQIYGNGFQSSTHQKRSTF